MPVKEREAPPLEVIDEAAEARARRRWVRIVWTAVVVSIAGAALLLAVAPTKAWLDQRRAMRETQERLHLLNEQNAELQKRAEALQTPEEVERVAREQYNLVKPGEKVFTVLPEPASTELPSGWPFDLVRQIVTVHGSGASAAAAP